MKLDIHYRMHFRYSDPVTEAQNEVRVRPRDDDCQRVVSYRLASQPAAAVLQAVDYWGTVVEHLGVRTPHTEMELRAEASVETLPRPALDGDADRSAVREPSFRDAYFEMLAASPHVRWSEGDAVARKARAAVDGADTFAMMVAAVIEDVRATLRYEPGSTEIGVSLAEILEGRAGVCQDYAHLAIGMMRSIGIPARYVSGYLFAADETALPEEAASPDDAPEAVSVQTHAWLEAAVPGWGWWALDPTNGGTVGERHVVIGCGRDYGDVPPVRGAFMGSGTADVDAEVVIGKRRSRDAFVYAPRRPADPAAGVVPQDAFWGQQQQQQQ
ncbi:MAG: transglutaminase family protein [Acidimicrobiaceae bacterium]|nr:transglutaminase family protein [Acidimicrobiaceae bacterium]